MDPFTRVLACVIAVLPGIANGIDTSFTDRSAAAGVARSTESYGSSVADVDGDGYPDIYVSNHRKRPSLYVNQRDGTFVDMASRVQSWVWRPEADTHGGGFGDIDNDGDPDLLVTTGRGNDQQLFVNGNGELLDRTTSWNVGSPLVGGRIAVWYDYNNDRLLDMSVPQYGGVSAMYTNQGDRFSEDTGALSAICVRHMYAQLLDVNRDGVLDFICSGENPFPLAVFDMTTLPWTRITGQFPSVPHVVDSVIGDFDNDGRMDMFLISNLQTRPSGSAQHGERQVEFRTQGGDKAISFRSAGNITVDMDWNLFKRDDNAQFIFIGAGGRHPAGFPLTLAAGDVANQGMPPPAPGNRTPAVLMGFDPATNRWSIGTQTGNQWSDAYFTVTTEAPATDLRTTGLWPTDRPALPTLLMGTASGWADRTAGSGLTDPLLCASVTTGDFNNDMYLDLYLACREGAANLPNVLYYGEPGGRFRRSAGASGAIGPVGAAIGSGAGTADSTISADFDLDGFLDLFVTNGFNMRPKDIGGPGKFFRNNGNGNRWLMLDLVGTASVRDAIGARVGVTAAGVTQTRVQDGHYHRWVQEHSRMHFGMASAGQARVVIDWPSGQRDVHDDVAANHVYRVTEGRSIERLFDRRTDSDGDGLTDTEEESLGTDPDVADTDGGGADDGDEVAAGLNPVDDPSDDAQDSDGDGLSDVEEAVDYRTDPNDADSDGGGAQDGVEVAIGSDPLDAADDGNDGDADGLSDADEYAVHGTDADDPDTDDGGVTDGDEVAAGTNPLDPGDDKPAGDGDDGTPPPTDPPEDDDGDTPPPTDPPDDGDGDDGGMPPPTDPPDAGDGDDGGMPPPTDPPDDADGDDGGTPAPTDPPDAGDGDDGGTPPPTDSSGGSEDDPPPQNPPEGPPGGGGAQNPSAPAEPANGGGDGGGGGGCFIATAAYGSYLQSDVRLLRDFRDEHLLTNVPGRMFVEYYYEHSPPVAAVIAEYPVLRWGVRTALTPVVYAVKAPEASGAMMGLLFAGLLAWRRRPAYQTHQAAKATR